MKALIKNLAVAGGVLCSSMAIGQSNTPCNGSGAPLINVGATCNFTTASTVGATQQTNANNGGTPSCGAMGPDAWFTFVAPASGGVTIQTQAGSITDGVMALYSGTCGPVNLTELACNDDANGGLMPEITQGGLTPGVTYFIRIWQFGGGTGTMDICVVETNVAPPPTNVDCSVPDPICSGSPIVFTAQANGTEAATIDPGNNYDCLTTSPNPSWYYLEIDAGGDLAIDITAGSDVDFAIWGPYADLATAVANCNAYGVPVDCSYSTAATEQANVNGTLAGEVYVLLVTNFANTVQTITVSDAATNTATTDCSIVPLPVELAQFSGSREGREVYLNWTTASELNNDYFLVERSKDAVNWSAFDVIQGAGTTTNTVMYNTVDENPFNGVNYYRLRQFDTDGKVHYSDVISVANETTLDLQLFPNPAQSKVIINSANKFNKLTIRDINGKEILIRDNLSINQTYVDVRDFKNGIYYVSIESPNGVQTERLSVLK